MNLLRKLKCWLGRHEPTTRVLSEQEHKELRTAVIITAFLRGCGFYEVPREWEECKHCGRVKR